MVHSFGIMESKSSSNTNKHVAYFDSITDQIVLTIDKSNSTLRASQAWISEPRILNSISKAKERGVDVELLIDDNSRNHEALKLLNENGLGPKLFFRKNTNGQYSIMHNKYAVFDHHLLLTGSNNWTRNSSLNDENALFVQDSNISLRYLFDFHRLKLDSIGIKASETIYEIYPHILAQIEVSIISVVKKNLHDLDNLSEGEISKIESDQIECLLIDSIIVDRINQNHTPDSFIIRGIRWHLGEMTLGGVFNRHNEYLKETFINDYFEALRKSVPEFLTSFKVKALSRLISRYRNKLKDNMDDEVQSRILKVFMTLIHERRFLAISQGIVLYPENWTQEDLSA